MENTAQNNPPTEQNTLSRFFAASTSPSAPPPPAPETADFNGIVRKSLFIFKKKWAIFLGLSFLNMAIVAAVYLLGVPLVLTQIISHGPIFALIFFIPAILVPLISWLFYGTVSNQAASALIDSPAKVSESFSTTLKNTGKAINLAFKIFIYSGIWITVPLFLMFAASHNWQNVIPAPAPNIDHTFGGLISADDLPLRLSGSGHPEGEAPIGPLILKITDTILEAATLLVILFAIFRLLRAALAFAALTARPEITAKEALKQSVTSLEDKTLAFLFFLGAFSFLLCAIPLTLNLVFAYTGLAILLQISLVLGLMIGIFGYPLAISFLQSFLSESGNPAVKIKLGAMPIILALLPIVIPGAIWIYNNPPKLDFSVDKQISSIKEILSESAGTDNPATPDITATKTEDAATVLPETITRERAADIQKALPAIKLSGKTATVTVTNPNDFPLPGYPVKIVLDTATGFRPDCKDLFFEDENGGFISSSLESGCGTKETSVWVAPALIPASSQNGGKLVMSAFYGGGEDVSSLNDETKAFDFFDHFDTDTIGKKWAVNNGTWPLAITASNSVSINPANSQAELGGGNNSWGALTTWETFGDQTLIRRKFNRTENFGLVAEAKVKNSDYNNSDFTNGIFYHLITPDTLDFNTDTYAAFTGNADDAPGAKLRYNLFNGGSDYGSDKAFSPQNNEWYVARLYLSPTDSKNQGVKSSLLDAADTLELSSTTKDQSQLQNFYTTGNFALDNFSGGTMSVDWFRVRKVADKEPSVDIAYRQT